MDNAKETSKERNLEQDRLFTDSLKSIEKENFLGDRSTVEALLRMEVNKILDSDTLVLRKAEEKILSVCKEVADTLLGRNPKFRPLHNWNEPGKIDVFCAHWLGSSEIDPRDRMEHCVLKLFLNLLSLADYAAEPGVLPEQWRWQVDSIFNKYINVFMGVDPATEDIFQFSENEQASVVNEQE